MGFFSRKEKLDEGLAKTRKGFFAGILDMMNAGSIDDSFYDDLEDQLILADAGADEADRLVTALRQRVRHEHIKNAAEALEALKSIIVEELRADGPMDLSGRPAVIMVIGVNGVGKTTSIAKLARLYKSQGKSVLLAAGDTFRAAAAEQLLGGFAGKIRPAGGKTERHLRHGQYQRAVRHIDGVADDCVGIHHAFYFFKGDVHQALNGVFVHDARPPCLK